MHTAEKYPFTWRVSLKHSLVWVYQTLKKLLVRRYSRYFDLTPPFFLKHTIYDSKKHSTFPVTIRDLVDYSTLQQIYIWESYRLRDLGRFDDIEKLYTKQVNAGLQPLIIDCGANIGLAAKYFSQEFHESKIIAIEPEAGNVTVAAINNSQSSNVSILKAAIAAIDGKGRLFNLECGNNSCRVIEDADGAVEMISINSLLAESERANTKIWPFIVKIDIEGFENELFSKNVEWVERFPILIIELHDSIFFGQGYSGTFLRAISKLDRDFIYIGENIFSICNRFGRAVETTNRTRS
jgi:FkbM family methyltransferase